MLAAIVGAFEFALEMVALGREPRQRRAPVGGDARWPGGIGRDPCSSGQRERAEDPRGLERACDMLGDGRGVPGW